MCKIADVLLLLFVVLSANNDASAFCCFAPGPEICQNCVLGSFPWGHTRCRMQNAERRERLSRLIININRERY